MRHSDVNFDVSHAIYGLVQGPQGQRMLALRVGERY